MQCSCHLPDFGEENSGPESEFGPESGVRKLFKKLFIYLF